MSKIKGQSAQIALPLGPVSAPGAGRIVVGAGNFDAVEALSRPDTWPYRTAIIMGPARSGKSLLARWFVEQGGGEAIDDADQMPEDEVFHHWNRAQESGTPLLLTVALREEGWAITLPDLRSRLNPALRVEIGAPDDAMMIDLLAAHAEAHSLPIGEDGLAYLASRAERSHLGAERLVAAIDRISLERKAPPGPGIWREALDETQGPEQPGLL